MYPQGFHPILELRAYSSSGGNDILKVLQLYSEILVSIIPIEYGNKFIKISFHKENQYLKYHQTLE